MSQTDKAKVIVVDDDDKIRKALTQILEHEGYEVIATIDGKKALEITARRKFDLMFLDMMMPGYSGMDVLTLMQAARPDMPIVIISALDKPEIKNQALSLGAYDYITKPFGAARVLEAASKALIASKEKAEADLTEDQGNTHGYDDTQTHGQY